MMTHKSHRPALALAGLALLLILGQPISQPIESQATAAAVPGNATTATSTTSTTAAPTTTTTTTTTTTAAPVTSTTMREPSEQEIQEARKLIHEIASTLKDNPTRLVVNRPASSGPLELAADSPEARIAEASSNFGLEFLRNLPEGSTSRRQNVVISPVSLQILLNIVLLGAKDGSATQRELFKVLGYEKLSSGNSTEPLQDQEAARRLQPHAAMHNLLELVARVTHLTIEEQQQQQQLQQQQQQSLLNSPQQQLQAHLQTSARAGEIPLSGQVNFTLANLMLTNSDLVRTSVAYEQELRRFYDVKLEQFSRLDSALPQAPGRLANATQKVGAPAPAALHERVNAWVRNVTQGQINQLVEAQDVEGGDLAMVLLNAAHFKGRWLHTFNAKLTQERPFYNEGQERGASETMFMRQNGVFGYAEFGGAASERSAAGASSHGHTHTSALSDETLLTEDLAATTTKAPPAARSADGEQTATPTATPTADDEEERQQAASEARRLELTARLNCSALMLPFSLNDGQELSMVVLLPSRRDGLAELVGALTGPVLAEVYKSLTEQQVQVEMPKFAFESAHEARAPLQTMGLERVFKEGAAELDRMLQAPSAVGNATQSQAATQPNSLKVDRVIHKAKIAVDEAGAEAAAASAATIVLRNLIRPPNPSFLADHPFLFVIRHNRSNLPLFMGRVERL